MDLATGEIPVFGYPAINYTPLSVHDDLPAGYDKIELGRERIKQSTRRAWKMWSKLTKEIVNRTGGQSEHPLLISKLLDQHERLQEEEQLRMKAFAMGIKYTKLVELVKEEEQRLNNNGSPTAKVLPPRPNLNERKDEERDIVQE